MNEDPANFTLNLLTKQGSRPKSANRYSMATPTSPMMASKGFATNDCRNGQNLWFHEKDRMIDNFTSQVQKDQSDRLSLPRRVAQKWDENIKFFEDVRASSNLSTAAA